MEPSICSHYANYEIFNSENKKNKECGHTWANGMATLVEGYSNFSLLWYFG